MGALSTWVRPLISAFRIFTLFSSAVLIPPSRPFFAEGVTFVLAVLGKGRYTELHLMCPFMRPITFTLLSFHEDTSVRRIPHYMFFLYLHTRITVSRLVARTDT